MKLIGELRPADLHSCHSASLSIEREEKKSRGRSRERVDGVMGRVKTALQDCEHFLVAGVLCFVLSLCISAWMIGLNIINEMDEFTEKMRSELEEFQIIAEDSSKTIHDLTLKSIGEVEESDLEASNWKTFDALLRLHRYERKQRYRYREAGKP